MYKVLIVDDEPFVREGLKAIIEWNEYGYEICGEAANGKMALELIEKLKPELVIVDMKMRGMDGMGVIEETRKSGIKCKFIILTGYAEFDYAVKAISNRVDAYLLKPVDEDELVDAIKKIKNKLEDELQIDDTVLIRNVVHKILFEQFDEKLLAEYYTKYDINLEWTEYQGIMVDFYEEYPLGDFNKDAVWREFEKLIEENNYGYCFLMNDVFCILFKPLCGEVTKNYLNLLKQDLETACKKQLVMAASKKKNNINDMKLCFRDLHKLITNKFIFGDNIILAEEFCDIIEDNSGENASYSDDFLYKYLEALKENLLVAITINDCQSIEKQLKSLKESLLKRCDSEDAIKLIYSNMYNEIIKKLNDENGFVLEEELIKNQMVVNEINKKGTLLELNEYVKEVLSYISNKVVENSSDARFKRLVDYIERNCDKDLKLETLAEIYNYSSKYLGKQFKLYTGEHFNTYLHLVRIEKAKKLLGEGGKVGEVAKKVGYSNIDYFYTNFKKYAGVPPSFFKK